MVVVKCFTDTQLRVVHTHLLSSDCVEQTDPLSSAHCVLTNHNPLRHQKSDKIQSDMRACMLDACGRVVQNSIGEAYMFLLTRVREGEPNGSVYFGSVPVECRIQRKTTFMQKCCISNFLIIPERSLQQHDRNLVKIIFNICKERQK